MPKAGHISDRPRWVEVRVSHRARMLLTDSRLVREGFRPHLGAFDCAFDAFFVYEYFHSDQHEGFAAVPLAQKGGYNEHSFDPTGLPLCQAGLAMPLKFTFTDRTRAIIEHERGKYVCPLRFPEANGKVYPIANQNTLIYVLINLRTLRRIRQRKAA